MVFILVNIHRKVLRWLIFVLSVCHFLAVILSLFVAWVVVAVVAVVVARGRGCWGGWAGPRTCSTRPPTPTPPRRSTSCTARLCCHSTRLHKQNLAVRCATSVRPSKALRPTLIPSHAGPCWASLYECTALRGSVPIAHSYTQCHAGPRSLSVRPSKALQPTHVSTPAVPCWADTCLVCGSPLVRLWFAFGSLPWAWVGLPPSGHWVVGMRDPDSVPYGHRTPLIGWRFVAATLLLIQV